MKFILLELYVDNTRPELYELYKNQIEIHNADIDNNPYPNAGFDLFIPDNVVFDTPFQTKMVDLGVKAQMWEFLPTSKDYTKPAILINDDTKNTITEGEVEEGDPSTNEVDIKSDSGVVFSKEGLESFQDYMATGYHLFPRSSIAKTQLIMSNHVGVIDSGYRNNLLAAFRYLPVGEEKTYTVASGTRLVQICHPSLFPIYVNLLTDEKYLTKTTRTGGFGSTGGTV